MVNFFCFSTRFSIDLMFIHLQKVGTDEDGRNSFFISENEKNKFPRALTYIVSVNLQFFFGIKIFKMPTRKKIQKNRTIKFRGKNQKHMVT